MFQLRLCIHTCFTHGEKPSEHRSSYFNRSSKKWPASTEWPLTFNLCILYSRRCLFCLATGSQPSLRVMSYRWLADVLMIFPWWDMALWVAGFSGHATHVQQPMCREDIHCCWGYIFRPMNTVTSILRWLCEASPPGNRMYSFCSQFTFACNLTTLTSLALLLCAHYHILICTLFSPKGSYYCSLKCRSETRFHP